jgi:uncharacterized protein YndB with AHSA1/START domain
MIRSAKSVTVSRTPEEVFAFVSDLRNEPRWHVDIESVPADTDVPPLAGKTYPMKFKPFMGKTAGTFTAVEVGPGHRLVFRADFAGLQPMIIYTVEPDGSGARFTRAVEMQPRGLKMLMTPMMSMMVPKRNQVFVANLKRVLES